MINKLIDKIQSFKKKAQVNRFVVLAIFCVIVLAVIIYFIIRQGQQGKELTDFATNIRMIT